MIFDFRISIFDWLGISSLCRFTARDKHSRDLIGLIKQSLRTACGQQLCLNGDFQPKATLIGFFLHNRGFVNKILTRFSSAEGAVIRANRTSAADELVSNGITRSSAGNSIN